MSWVLIVIGIIGLLVYVLSSNGKAAEIGRIVFMCAFFMVCLALLHGGSAALRLGR